MFPFPLLHIPPSTHALRTFAIMERKKIDIQKVFANEGQIDGLPRNPRTMRKEKFDKLMKSIRDLPEMTEARDLLVYPHDGKFVVLGGNMRLRAYRELGWKEVPCCILPEGMPTDKLREIVIQDNNPFGETDWDMIANEWDIEELKDWGVDLPESWNVSPDVELKDAEEDDFSTEDAENAEPRVKPGEIWQLGEHRLMCGDSTDADSVAILMDGQKADMVLSDPPYGMHLDTDFSSCLGSLGRKKGSRGNRYEKVIGDHDDFSPALISTFFLNFNETKEMFIFGADYFAELLPNKNNGSWLVWDKRKESQADAIGSEFELIWSKNKHKRRVLRHDWFGFLSSGNSQDARNRVHPTQKPVTLLTDIINQWGKDVESIVDLYGGSGTTLIACEQLHRRCYMMELDPHYCDVIIARWEKLTGEEAVKIHG